MHTKKLWNQIVSILFAIALLSVSALAELRPEDTAHPDVVNQPEFKATVSHVNPEYAHLGIRFPEPTADCMTTAEITVGTTEEAVEYLREQMENRVTEVTISVENYTYVDNWTDILYSAFAHTGVPTQGDYLVRHYYGSSGLTNVSGSTATFLFNIRYLTTLEQENAVDDKIDELFTTWDEEYSFRTLSDYKQIKIIYDYICANVTYDHEHWEQYGNSYDGYPLMYTAYAALINGTAVCQGYANLFYRMALEAGIDTRIIVGDAGEYHAWNIVELDEKYYYLDATWDAPRFTSGYRYFLLGSDNFCVDHTPEVREPYHCDVTTYPIDTEDYFPPAFGECGAEGENLTWTLTKDGTLTISGEGKMYDYDYDCPWYDYRKHITAVVIENGVTTIGDQAFYRCTSLTSVIIPDSVTTIGDHAFSTCNSLTSVTIPDSVTTISESAFFNCTSLTSVTIPDSVTTIGSWAFYNCTSLTSVTIGDSVTTIGDHAFYNCTSLTTVYYGGSLKQWVMVQIDMTGNENLTNVELICLNSEPISGTFGDNLTWSLTDDGILTISGIGAMEQDAPWYDYRTWITAVVIDEGVTEIGEYAFYSYTSLTSVTIGDSVTTIGYHAFSYCSSLTSVTIGDSVTTIGNLAFSDCTNLTSVTIPDSVTTIGNRAFYNCTSLTTVYYGGTEEQWNEISIGGSNGPLLNAEIIFEGEAVHTHTEEIVLGYDATCTEDGLTDGTKCSTCGEILVAQDIIPATGHIEEVISGCPATLTAPGLTDGAKCSVCETVLVAQEEIPALTEISGTCGENLTWTLTNEGVLTISGEGAMFSFTEESAPFAPWSDYTTFIVKVVVEDGVTSIGDNAFAACENLKEIEIPETVTAIGDNVFTGCEALETITYTGSEEQWDEITLGEGNETLEDAEIVIEDVLRGDVNGDGYVNSNDSIYLLRHILTPNRYPINQNGDMNGDGYVNSNDAIYLLRHTLTPSRYPLH